MNMFENRVTVGIESMEVGAQERGTRTEKGCLTALPFLI